MGERIANRLAVPAIVKLVKYVLQYVKATISPQSVCWRYIPQAKGSIRILQVIHSFIVSLVIAVRSVFQELPLSLVCKGVVYFSLVQRDC